MGFGEAVRSAFNKYVTFSGRARRSEYWWFFLFCLLANAVADTLDSVVFGVSMMRSMHGVDIYGPSVFGGIVGLLTFLPGISVMVRRLHDTGRSGWWVWIVIIPLIGVLFLIYWMIKRGDYGTNNYGPDPITNAGAPRL